MPAVNPEILKWARETAGLTLAEAAQAITLPDAHGKTGAERLESLEAGDSEPSRPLLLRMSQKYRRSLLVFYLSEPPQKEDRGQDFRTLPKAQAEAFNGNLDALIRDIKARQSLVKSLLEDEDVQPLQFIGSVKINDDTRQIAENITQTLRFSLTDFRAQNDTNSAFRYLRQRIESVGIFVLLLGDLGSHQSAIPVEIFRGFAIADDIAPFVVINDQDARQAWAFTALHEVVHLWLGTTGISGNSDEVYIEQFCNEVAGNILLPTQELNALQGIQTDSLDSAVYRITDFAKERNLSRAMVAYKMFKVGGIERQRWQQFVSRFNQDRLETQAKTKEQETGGGPNYYVVRRHRLGQALLDLVSRAISEGTVSTTKAGKILGVKPRNVEPLLNYVPPRGS